jgi:hypothetical protein
MRDRQARTAGVVALLALAGALGAEAQETVARRRKPPLPAAPLGEVVSQNIRYDTGVNAGFPTDVGLTVVGNRFNSGLGDTFLRVTHVTRLTLFPQNDGVQSFSFWLPPNSMGVSAPAPAGFMNANLVGGAFNQVVVSPEAVNGPDFILTFIGAFDGSPAGLLGLDAMATMDQGFHGVSGMYVAPNLTMVQPIPGRNAMLRVSGEFLIVPVELVNFRVE